jgi:hypothetical protein
MALANVTDMFEGAVGALLYRLLSQPTLSWVIGVFHGSFLDIAGVKDERTLILELFVYVSLAFTLLTLPFISLLRREFARRGIVIDLAGRGESVRHGQRCPLTSAAPEELPRDAAGREDT